MQNGPSTPERPGEETSKNQAQTMPDVSATRAPSIVAHVKSVVIAPHETTVPRLEELRRTHGADFVLLYDVSPVGVTPQLLFDELRAHPRVVIFDHHGACAPLCEIPGRELCAAEVIAQDLPVLARSTSLGATTDRPQTILVVTHSRNIDPDAFISRLLIESFFDPTRRPFVWDIEEHRNLLVEAARFGDTTFFGGVALESAQAQALDPAHRLGLALLELINEGKEQFVCEHLREAAVLNRNLVNATAKVEPELFQAGRTVLAIRSVYRSIERQNSADDPHGVSATAEQALKALLGSEYLTWESIKERVIASCEGSEEGSKLEHVNRMLRRAILESLFPSQIRELFQGKKANNIYGPPHPARWNENSIEALSERITASIPELLTDDSKMCALADCFIRDMRRVSAVAGKHTSTVYVQNDPERRVSITAARYPINPDAGIPRSQREYLMYDWLREAAAALSVGDHARPYLPPAWLHVMDRGDGNIVVSSRFARHDEERPDIDLSRPEVIAELIKLEREAAARTNQLPTNLIIKGNLWLPDGGPLHISTEAVVELLKRHYDVIVQPPSSSRLAERVYPSIVIAPGNTAQFNGMMGALLAELSDSP